MIKRLEHIYSWLIIFVFSSIAVIVSIVLLAKSAENDQPPKECTLFFNKNITLLNISLAETRQQQIKGLAHQDSISVVMLFSWPKSSYRAFWMHDTRIPLSVGFFSEEGILFQIEDMQPNTDDYHYSYKPASDALELPQGKFAELGLKVGSKLINRDCMLLH